jgi:4-hydroxybenzoate polyprenyltransferase
MTLARTVRTWGEMVKFSHSIFALPFAVIAMMLAARGLPGGVPSWEQVALIIACMVAARSFAMTFNRVADAAIDARNPRTAGRPLPAGRITPAQAWAVLVLAAGLFVLLCAGFLAYGNRWPLILSAPVLAVLAAYSYTKRFTAYSHFVLGGAIGFAPLAAWTAINPATLGLPVVVLSAAVMLWIAGFDLIYACQDIEIDRREGLFSMPSKLGAAAALTVSRICHAATVALLVVLGRLEHLGPIYYAGVAAVAALLIVEQSLVRPDDLSRVNVAFFTINGAVSVVFAAAAIVDVLTG